MPDSFFTTLDFISSWIWPISCFAAPWMFINFLRFRRAQRNPATASVRFPWISTTLFLGPILFTSFAGSILAFHERHRVLEFLNNPGADATVIVDGIKSGNADEVLSVLKNLAPLAAHHSNPTETLVIDIRSNRGELHLNLGRDSGDRHEYWVFSPAYWSTTRNEIGRLKTPVFDYIP